MIEFKDLELTDKKMIDDYFSKGQYQNSECTFTNLFIWRNCYAVQWAIVDSFLVIKPAAANKSWVLMPYGEDDEKLPQVLLRLKQHFAQSGEPLVVRAVTEQDKERLARAHPEEFVFTDEPDIADYVYAGDDLRELKGRHYSQKRNHINAFLRDYPNYQYEALTAENIIESWHFIERWCEERKCGQDPDSSLLCERYAIREALDHFEALDYQGGIIRVDGEIVAFTMGEMVNDETVVIHVEKAFPHIRGLYPMINQTFLQQTWPNAKYVNREEDMGDPGLRKAKLSYHPTYLLKKYKGEI